MTRGAIRASIVTAKIDVVRRMLAGIATLPLASEEELLADPRMVAAGESYLRRALEALLDLGRHLLAKGFGLAATEYKAVPGLLHEQGILDDEMRDRLTEMAGYRNRLVHFYDEVTPAELYTILTVHLGDVERVLEEIRGWLAEHASRVDGEL